MNNETDSSVIKTSDFVLASTLYHLGFRFKSIDKTNRKRVIFYFNKTSDIENIIKDYFDKKILITPQEFDVSQRETRGQIFTDL